MAVKQMPVAILADANILIKDVVSASFFDLNKLKLISLHWTPEIEAEYIEHRARIRAEKNNRAIQVDDLAWASARIETNKKYLVPNSLPEGWFVEETLETMRSNPKYAALCELPDPDDIHVAMAAAFIAEASDATAVLATHDLTDFPQKILEPFNVVVLHSGIVLEMLYLCFPTQVQQSLLQTCTELKNPKFTTDMFLNSIAGKNQFDNPSLSATLKAAWSQADTYSEQADPQLQI